MYKYKYIYTCIVVGIKSIDDLADQRDIMYGSANGTAHEIWFKTQDYEPFRKMYAFMQSENTWVNNASVGIQKVRDSYDIQRGKEI